MECTECGYFMFTEGSIKRDAHNACIDDWYDQIELETDLEGKLKVLLEEKK